MAWSAKIRLGNGGIPLFNEWEVIYDASTQPTYKTAYGVEISQQEPDILWHTPDSAPPSPVRANAKNEQMFLTMDVNGEDWNTIISSLAPLKRAVGGASSQAMAYATNGTQDKVTVEIIPDGSSVSTYFDVISGVIDDSGAYYKPEAVLNKIARQVVFYLTIKPGGYGDSFTLRNDLPSSPHFIEDSDSDGLADGWVAIGPPTTTDIVTNNYLIGGKCQRFVTDNASLHGIRSDSVTASTSTNAVANVWVASVDSNDDVLSIILQDGSNNNIDTITHDPSSPTGYDFSFISQNGRVFYRYTVSGQNTTAADFRLRIARTATNATVISTYYADGAYLKINETTTQLGWCSSSSLKNRYDPSVAEANINYLDVWGVPGDLPAYIRTTATPTTGYGSQYICFKYQDGANLAADIPYWQDSADFDVGSSTWSTGTGTTENHYFRLATATASGSLTRAIDWKYFTDKPFVLYAAIRSSTLSSSVSFQVNTNSIFSIGGYLTLFQSEEVSVNVVNGWELHNFGLVNLTDITESTQSKNLYLDLTATNSGSNTVDFGFVIPAPVLDDSYLIAKTNIGLPAATNTPPLLIDGVNEKVRRADDYLAQPFVGKFYQVSPGISNRLVFVETAADTATTYTKIDITTDPTISLTVTPRASHLLGTG